mmetsp:Transcript_65169/g.128925  ORF Transcript_65169/g.128925 Transcript_65169/m.128925 type:complete len:265 (+) Transcript_65169:1178-1972(+)
MNTTGRRPSAVGQRSVRGCGEDRNTRSVYLYQGLLHVGPVYAVWCWDERDGRNWWRNGEKSCECEDSVHVWGTSWRWEWPQAAGVGGSWCAYRVGKFGCVFGNWRQRRRRLSWPHRSSERVCMYHLSLLACLGLVEGFAAMVAKLLGCLCISPHMAVLLVPAVPDFRHFLVANHHPLFEAEPLPISRVGFVVLLPMQARDFHFPRRFGGQTRPLVSPACSNLLRGIAVAIFVLIRSWVLLVVKDITQSHGARSLAGLARISVLR